ncbi:MAG: polyvinyl alcohol dehydrogenase (cytochrome) [Saprospiraceae bacterium]
MREGRVYFADFTGNIYALRANNGGLIWKKSIKNEPESAVTGTPTYYNSLLYIPMSSMESNTAVLLSYECSKNSGQIVALKGLSGKEAWRHRIINGKATEKGLNSAGIKKYGPSGSAIWSSPTIDAKRGLLYIGTGQNYSNTPTTISDARQALDLMTGELRWNYQATSKDVFVRLCPNPDNPNCEDASGPDLDFGIAPILVTRNDGKEVLLSGQKSGVVHCLNPDDGRLIWKKRIGRGGAMGGIHWGIATDVNRVFVPNSDMFEVGSDSEYPASSGLYALDLMSGEVEWKSSSDPNVCESKPGCYNSYSAAPSVIQGVVFAGSLDGHARAYDSDTGEVLWDFDTYREFETINKVDANGGSIDGPGPVIINGMVFFSSGYSIAGQMLGNVLLAFSDE